MRSCPLGKTGLQISPLGFGAFKIGRNQGAKYPEEYPLPDEAAVGRLLNEVLDMGVNYIDTAPAYGLSEERIGRTVAHRRDEYVLSTKVGETFADGESNYDFSASAVRDSVHRSLKRLQTDVLDIVFIHSNGGDSAVLNETDIVETLAGLKADGAIRAIGMSGKTAAGAQLALQWADVIMVQYHIGDVSHAGVIAEAARERVGVVVKKGLASGRLSAGEAIRFVLSNERVAGIVVGGLSVNHIRDNAAVADECRPDGDVV